MSDIEETDVKHTNGILARAYWYVFIFPKLIVISRFMTFCLSKSQCGKGRIHRIEFLNSKTIPEYRKCESDLGRDPMAYLFLAHWAITNPVDCVKSRLFLQFIQEYPTLSHFGKKACLDAIRRIVQQSVTVEGLRPSEISILQKSLEVIDSVIVKVQTKESSSVLDNRRDWQNERGDR